MSSMERMTGFTRFALFPSGRKPSDELLKMPHWGIFQTEFQPNGFEPLGEVKIKNEQEIFLLVRFNGADDGVRTRDPNLGKVVLYQLSHIRICCISKKRNGGRYWVRTSDPCRVEAVLSR